MSLIEMPAIAPVSLRIGPASAGVSMCPDEFDAITEYDDSVNYELINGVLVVTPMSSRFERSPNDLLGFWLHIYQDRHPEGACLVDTIFEEYVRTRSNRRRDDRVIWVARTGIPRTGIQPDPGIDIPTIVVEFVSPGKAAWRRDYMEKRDEYLEAGVVEYWVIDRFSRQLSVYALQAGQPTERVVHETETYRTDLLPGFELPLAALLAAADKWRQAEQQ